MDSQEWIQAAADQLFKAEQDVVSIEPLTDARPETTVPEAYAVQMVNVRRRVEGGETVRGHKIGFTSKAMQRQLGLEVPDYGHLMAEMFCEEEADLGRSQFLAPRVEPELAFVLARDLEGPGVNAADVIRATEFAVPALEIIDSRIVDWRIKIQDTIADNASAARVVLSGRPHSLRDLDLPNTPMVMRKNGVILETATGAAVLGNPVTAVAWLANALAEYEVRLEAGHVVLTGSFCTSTFVTADDAVTATFGDLGSVTTHFVQ